jgi:hypothetical protein
LEFRVFWDSTSEIGGARQRPLKFSPFEHKSAPPCPAARSITALLLPVPGNILPGQSHQLCHPFFYGPPACSFLSRAPMGVCMCAIVKRKPVLAPQHKKPPTTTAITTTGLLHRLHRLMRSWRPWGPFTLNWPERGYLVHLFNFYHTATHKHWLPYKGQLTRH